VTTDARVRRGAILLWTAQFVSIAGDALFMPCLAWIAASAGDRASLVGLAVFLAFLPYLLLGPVAGAWVDRGDRRRIMVISDLLRAALLLALPWLAAAFGGMSYALIVGVGFLLAAFSTPFVPARDALLPDLLATGAEGGPSLARWNAIMQISGQLAMICGLGLGGLLLGGSAVGAAGDVERVVRVLQLDGGTFLASALLLALLVLPRTRRRARPTTPLRREVREGLAYAARDPLVGGLLLLTALDNLAIMGPAIVGAALLVRDVYHLGAGAYAWFEGCMAVGMVLGSLALVVLGRRVSLRRVVLWGMVMDGLTYLPYVWLDDYAVSLVVIALHGAFIPLIVVGRTTLIQRHVPRERHGRVFALVGITVIGMSALSAALSGWIAEWTGPRALFGLAGVFGAFCGILGFALWRGPEDVAALKP